MVNIAVFVSGSGTNLQAIIDACQNNQINGKIKLVVSNRKKAYGLERAKQANIKALWLKDEDLILSELEKENCIIISGNTMIKFKNKYSYKQNNEIDDRLYQICFNKENTIFYLFSFTDENMDKTFLDKIPFKRSKVKSLFYII